MASNRRKTPPKLPEVVKELATQGAVTVIDYFLDNPTIKEAYVKILYESGMAIKDIEKACHVSNAKIKEIVASNNELLENGMVETLKNIEVNRLYLLGGKILEALGRDGKIESMKGGDLAYTYKTLMEARRLLENKSTANISVLISTLTKKFDEEGRKLDRMMRGIAKVDPSVKEEPVAEFQHSG